MVQNRLKMLINLSNHPYRQWGEEQKKAAGCYGECIDLPFPNIPAEYDETEVDVIANRYLDKILSYGRDLTVHVMGEQTFCYALISRLLKHGITCIASCTARDVTMLQDGSKQARFHFTRFRKYK